jgi:hypothetical protein
MSADYNTAARKRAVNLTLNEDSSLKATVATWNAFAEKHGSFDDGHSTL